MGFFPLFAGGRPGGLPPGATVVYRDGTVIPNIAVWTAVGVGLARQDKIVYTLDDPAGLVTLEVATPQNLDGAFKLGSFPNLTYADLSTQGLTTWAASSNSANLQTLILAYNPLTAINLTGLTGLIDINLSSTYLNAFDPTPLDSASTIDLSGCSFLYTVSGYNYSAAVIACIDCTHLDTFTLSGFLGDTLYITGCPNLTMLSVAGMTNLTTLVVNGSGLTETTLNTILADLVLHGNTSGAADLTVINGVVPTGGNTNADYVQLTAVMGWSIVINS